MEQHGAVATTDVWAGPALYRVYLLSSTLQVDLSFWPHADFASSGPPVEVVFGAANEPRPTSPRDPQALIGTAWLYAIHVRSSIARGRLLQALYMLNTLRDQIVTLAALRHGLPAAHARGADDLPTEQHRQLLATVPGQLTEAELHRAFETAAAALLKEVREVDASLADRLAEPLDELVRTARAAAARQ
jgi:hypothetical protein